MRDELLPAFETQRRSILNSLNFGSTFPPDRGYEPMSTGPEPPAPAAPDPPETIPTLDELAAELASSDAGPPASVRARRYALLRAARARPVGPGLDREPACSALAVWLETSLAFQAPTPAAVRWHLWRVLQLELDLPRRLGRAR